MSENEDFDDLEIEEEKKNSETPVVTTKVPTSKIPKDSRVSLFFRSTIGPGEKLEKLTIDPEMGVSDLKETLGGIFGLDPQDFHISISGRTLDADDVLSNYDIEDGLECLIIPVSTAGSIN
ncbi:MAG: ubiquitin-like domain-containing protein [Promethearchaeota archaeon]